MKKVTTLLMLTTFLLAGCVNHIDDDEDDEEEIAASGPAVKLLVETRGEGTASLTYPITVYAFDAEGQCEASQTITGAGEALALTLVPGNYHLTALAGTDGYTLPSPMQRTSLVTLTGGAPATSALMSGSADITAAAGASANIRLSYRVARLALTLTEIPTEVTAVQVRFSPQYAGYSMQGSFSGGDAVNTVTCTKQAAAGTWTAPEFYLFPGSGQQTVFTIVLTRADNSTSTYGYTYAAPLLAATPYVLSGSYKEGFDVGGSFEAEGWKPTVNITFDFGLGADNGGSESGGSENGGESGSGESGSSESGDAISVTELPAVPSIWKGTCVMGVSNRTATTATLLVMSLEEWSGLTPADATSTVASYTLATLPGAWRLPAEADVAALRDARKTPGSTSFDALLTGAGGKTSNASASYLCTTTGGSYLKYPWGGTTAPAALGDTPSFRARAVRSVPVTITSRR